MILRSLGQAPEELVVMVIVKMVRAFHVHFRPVIDPVHSGGLLFG